jgi:HTH-type transcriptional regulator/antitoxin HigA
MTPNQVLYSDAVIPPGEYLQETIEELEISQAELARRMGRPIPVINEIIKGSKSITPDTALQLEQVTSVPAHVWMGLEDEYQLVLARQQELLRLEEEAEQVNTELYKALATYGYVKPLSGRGRQIKLERVRELWRFFGVTSLAHVREVNRYRAAFRVSVAGDLQAYALAAWLRCGEKQAIKQKDVQPFHAVAIERLIPQLRSWSKLAPQETLPKLTSALANCGVILVLVPHLPKTRAHGAAYWLSPTKAVIQLSIRGKYADIFWFSLFHELGHLLKHGKRDVHVEDRASKSPRIQQLELEADYFAQNALVPPDEYERFVLDGDFGEESVKGFAHDIDVAPGTVVGRLQNDVYIGRNELNHLRDKYEWAVG